MNESIHTIMHRKKQLNYHIYDLSSHISNWFLHLHWMDSIVAASDIFLKIKSLVNYCAIISPPTNNNHEVSAQNHCCSPSKHTHPYTHTHTLTPNGTDTLRKRQCRHLQQKKSLVHAPYFIHPFICLCTNRVYVKY